MVNNINNNEFTSCFFMSDIIENREIIINTEIFTKKAGVLSKNNFV